MELIITIFFFMQASGSGALCRGVLLKVLDRLARAAAAQFRVHALQLPVSQPFSASVRGVARSGRNTVRSNYPRDPVSSRKQGA
jgi:hypothetical protein